jgi:hypothetical protein
MVSLFFVQNVVSENQEGFRRGKIRGGTRSCTNASPKLGFSPSSFQ